ncbi:hypothetical protein PPERSA_10618 [Pseudocohnilembus persalinus]|uniref:Uncharacterized protein n=1 Tax=Pseudocohnilembus persalinus TaxID=266149 RepID=A0A0V0R0A0_PSEPJ|nr:hypothetical protein PPERSA_10618 [Pseudocohnilembus persalinus]|eukprot:KRX07983.1 hypothetical protein PPERSA_10618 [Pseudocohnilembus persalinus]
MEIEEKSEQLEIRDIQNGSQKSEYNFPKHIIDYNEKQKKLILKINKTYHVNFICDLQNYLKFGINLKKVKKIKVIFSGEEPVNSVSSYDIYKQGYIEKIRDFIFENEDFQQNLQGIKIDHNQDTYYNSYNMNIAGQWFKNVGKRLRNLREISFCVSSFQDLSQENLGVFFGELVQLKKLESLSLKNWEDLMKVDDFRMLLELNQKSLEEFGESLEFVRNLKRFKYKNFKQQDLEEYQNLLFAEKVDVSRGISLFENLEELSLAIDLDMDSGELGFLVGLQKLNKLEVFVNNMQKSRNQYQSEQKDKQNGDDIALIKKVIGQVLQARQVEKLKIQIKGALQYDIKNRQNLGMQNIFNDLHQEQEERMNKQSDFLDFLYDIQNFQNLEDFELNFLNCNIVIGQSQYIMKFQENCCKNLKNFKLIFNDCFIYVFPTIMYNEKYINTENLDTQIQQKIDEEKKIKIKKDIIQEILQFSNMPQLVVKSSMKNLLQQDKNKNCQISDLLQQKIDVENEYDNEDYNKQEDFKEIDQDQSEDNDYQPDNDLDKHGISEEEESFECEQNSFFEE